MEALSAFAERFGDDPLTTLVVLGIAGGALLLLLVFGLASDRKELRRRASDGVQPATTAAGASGKGAKPPFARLVAFLDQNLSGEAKQNRLLRLQLIQAGFFDQRAVTIYFGARFAGALALGIAGMASLPFLLGEARGARTWLLCGALAIIGYFLPTMAMKRRITKRTLQHRMGFPDFMDLMVVCAEAGLSMEAAIERIARELVEGYPSLAENLYMTSLEIRAGKTFSEAFERLGERLGIEEAMMLATLLQQSAELGTSLSNSLRVYSDEMRSKRLSRAEEKAYSLPAKLTVPLILFVFPVLLFVLMLPVVIRISAAGLGG
jgi:tight adherence protein C